MRSRSTFLPLRHALTARCSEAGLTLVELMISLSLGLLVVAAAIALLLSTKSGYATQDEEAVVQDTGRYALENIARSVRQTAYENWDSNEAPVVSKADISPNINGLDAFSLKATSVGMQTPVSKSINGSDVLAVRFFGSGPQPAGDGTIVNCAGFSVPAAVSQNSAEDDRGWSIYYVAESASGEPELYCKYSGDKGWTAQAIARGVESFQVLYGLDTDGDGLANQLVTATEIKALDDALVLEGANAEAKQRDKNRKTYWKKVVLLKIALLLRGERGTRGDAQKVQYDLFGKDYAASHGTDDAGTTIKETDLGSAVRNRMRRVFATTIQLRNRSSGSVT